MEPPRLRVMDAGDVTAVMEIERGSFAAGWPRTAFARELSGNAMARYIVLEAPAPAQDGPRRLIGFGGIWLMLDEAHVVTVAVAPEFRRKGFGRNRIARYDFVRSGLGLLSRSAEQPPSRYYQTQPTHW